MLDDLAVSQWDGALFEARNNSANGDATMIEVQPACLLAIETDRQTWRQAAEELQVVRLVVTVLIFLAGIGLGAGVMYLVDRRGVTDHADSTTHR